MHAGHLLAGPGTPPRPCTLPRMDQQRTPPRRSRSAAHLLTQPPRTGSKGCAGSREMRKRPGAGLAKDCCALAGGHPWARCTLGEQHRPGDGAEAQVCVWGDMAHAIPEKQLHFSNPVLRSSRPAVLGLDPSNHPVSPEQV